MLAANELDWTLCLLSSSPGFLFTLLPFYIYIWVKGLFLPCLAKLELRAGRIFKQKLFFKVLFVFVNIYINIYTWAVYPQTGV